MKKETGIPSPQPTSDRTSLAATPISPDPIDRYFEVSLFSLLTVGFLTLAGTGRMDPFTVVFMSLALAARAALLWTRSLFQLSPRLVSQLTVFYIPFYFLDFWILLAAEDTVLERLLLATVHLLFFTAVVKMFSARATRDHVYLAALGLAQMLAAATLTVNTSFLLYFALFLLLAIMTFTSLEIQRARNRVKGGESSASLLPQGAKLAPALSGTAAAICAGTAILTVVLFFVIPRGGRGYFSSLSLPTDRITGFSDHVELGEIGKVKRLSTVVMHVEAPGLSPMQPVKWRGIGLTTFDGRRWSNRNTLFSNLPGFEYFRFRQELYHPGQPPDLLRYTVTLQSVASDALFLAPQPVQLTGRFRGLWQDEAGSVFLRYNVGSMIRYGAVSDIATPRADLLRADTAESTETIRNLYLQLPELDPRIAQLALDITRGEASTYDKARAVESYLQKNYAYTLDLPAAMPADPIAYFLFDLRRGHCEFFASSMAVLLRSVGIPARLVNGFLQGSYNDVSEKYTVRASDAHTWVEVYFPTYGWVSFDPTPAEGRSQQALGFGRFGLYLDAMQAFWEEWVINYDFVHQVTLARQMEQNSRRWTTESREYLRQRFRHLAGGVRDATANLAEHRSTALLLLAFACLAFFGVWGRSLLGRSLREWKMFRNARQGKVRPQDATLAYLRLLRFLSRRGIRKLPAQTPSEFASAVPEPAGPMVRDFTQLYLGMRFGRSAEGLSRMTALLAQIEALRRAR